MTDLGTPVVFVHGYWLHHTSWDLWMELFTDAGYAPIAPPWPGEPDTAVGARAHRAPMAGYGVAEVTGHYASIIERLDRKPIIIGHSFGGLITQILAGHGLARAAVAIDPAPIKGVLALPPSAAKVVSMGMPTPSSHDGLTELTLEQWTYAFSHTRTPGESAAMYDRWSMPSSRRPLLQAVASPFNPCAATTANLANPARGPLLITTGGRDHSAPSAISNAAYRRQAKRSPAVTDLHTFPDRDHSLIFNSDWREVADVVLRWLKDKV